jgi:mRNA interferase MazF
VITRGDIVWADLGAGFGRRPVCVVTRDSAIEVLNALTCAPISRTIRGIPTEVEVGPEEGLAERCVINCDSLSTLPKQVLNSHPVGHLAPPKLDQLRDTIAFALQLL